MTTVTMATISSIAEDQELQLPTEIGGGRRGKDRVRIERMTGTGEGEMQGRGKEGQRGRGGSGRGQCSEDLVIGE